jgi:hypothetical protein
MDSKILSGVQIKDADQGRVEAVFSTFGVIDHDGDMTDPNAFTHGTKVLISAYNHKTWDGALPVGKGVIEVGPGGAKLKGQFFMDTQAGRDTFATVKALAEDGLGEWSYGFEVEDAEHQSVEGKSVRVLKKLRVYEVSPVIKGAGVGTHTAMVKAMDDDCDPKKKPKKPKPEDDEEESEDEDEKDPKKKPKKTYSLREEIDEATVAVKSVIESVERTVSDHAEAERKLSQAKADSLVDLRDALAKLDVLLSTAVETKEDATESHKEWLRYVALNLGVDNV